MGDGLEPSLYQFLASVMYLAAAAAVAGVNLMLALSRLRRVWHAVTRQHLAFSAGIVALQLFASILGLALFLLEAIEPILLIAVLANWLILVLALASAPAGLAYLVDHRPDSKPALSMTMAVFFGTVFVVAFSFGFIALVGLLVDIEAGTDLAPFLESAGGIVLFIPIAILAAFMEEILFRVGMQGLLLHACARMKCSPWWAIAATSGVWAIGHAGIMTPHGLKEFQIFVIGLIFGWLAWRYGPRAAILAHLGLNLTGVGAELVLRAMGITTG